MKRSPNPVWTFLESTPAGLVVACLLAAGAGGQTCGDCDRGGTVGITDALRASQMAALILPVTPDDLPYCDVDSSGGVDVLDALGMAQQSAGLNPTLSCPSQPDPVASGVTVTVPASGDVEVLYLLSDAGSQLCSITVEISTDLGQTFGIVATDAPGGDGRVALASSPGGIPHAYRWDSLTDLGPVATPDVVVRITPMAQAVGTPGESAPVLVDNRPPGQVSWSLDLHPRMLDITPAGPGCVNCHSGAFPAAGLDISTHASFLLGSGSGPVVIPFDPGSSLVVCKLEGGASCGVQMPRNGTPWTVAQVQQMRDWIAQGALDN